MTRVAICARYARLTRQADALAAKPDGLYDAGAEGCGHRGLLAQIPTPPTTCRVRNAQPTLKLTGLPCHHTFSETRRPPPLRGVDGSGATHPLDSAHSGFRTAERPYSHAHGIEAGRDDAAVIARLKGKGP